MSGWRSSADRAVVLEAYQEILSNWPQPNRQMTVPTEYGETFIIDSGVPTGDPIVLLHGSMSNSFTWRSDVALLGVTRRVIAVDIVGEPGRSAATPLPYAPDIVAGWLAAVLDALDIARCDLVGLSLGGWLATCFASRCPQRVAHLMLLAPGGFAPERAEVFADYQADATPEAAAEVMNQVMGQAASVDPQFAKAMAFSLLLAQHFEPRTDRLPVLDVELLERINLPVLLLFGEQENVLDASASIANARASIVDLSADVLPGVGHAVIGQAARLLEFMDR